jgi:hypothetical protein
MLMLMLMLSLFRLLLLRLSPRSVWLSLQLVVSVV